MLIDAYVCIDILPRGINHDCQTADKYIITRILHCLKTSNAAFQCSWLTLNLIHSLPTCIFFPYD